MKFDDDEHGSRRSPRVKIPEGEKGRKEKKTISSRANAGEAVGVILLLF
jgi:hypothetical protein